MHPATVDGGKIKILGIGIPQLLVILLLVACAIWCGNRANAKGYSNVAGVLLGLFLNVIGIIIVLLLPDKKEEESFRASVQAPDQLIKYKQLLDAGAITQEEFDRKKDELLHTPQDQQSVAQTKPAASHFKR